jgi:uncharacterized tellurite resistance protein B-like protein
VKRRKPLPAGPVEGGYRTAGRPPTNPSPGSSFPTRNTRMSGMVRTSNALALLKVLVTAAWADRNLSQTELNYIKELARRFDLDDDEWFQLQPYLEDPPTEEDCELAARDLLSRIGSAGERRAVLEHLERVVRADNEVSPAERELLARYERILSESSSMDLVMNRVRGLFAAPPPASGIDIDEFLKNKILFKLRRRIQHTDITPDMHEMAVVGGLMGIVAQADHEIDDRELQEIRRRLAARGDIEDEAMDLLLAIIREEAVRGLDRYRLIAEFSSGKSFEERTELLDLLFAVAAADGALTHKELEELRSISSALHLGHKQYIGAKVRVSSSSEG